MNGHTRNQLVSPPRPEVLQEMVRQLLTHPKIIEALSHQGRDKEKALMVANSIRKSANEKIAEGIASDIVAEGVLCSLAEAFLAIELDHEVEARGWSGLKIWTVEGHLGVFFTIEELGGEQLPVSTSTAIMDIVYLDWGFDQLPDPALVDYSLFYPDRFLSAARMVLSHEVTVLEKKTQAQGKVLRETFKPNLH